MSQLTRCRASGGLLRWPNLFGGECDALIPTNIFSPCVTWVMIHYYHCYDSLQLLSQCAGSCPMLSTLVCYSWSVWLSRLLPWKLSSYDEEWRMKVTGSNPAHPMRLQVSCRTDKHQYIHTSLFTSHCGFTITDLFSRRTKVHYFTLITISLNVSLPTH